MPRKADTEAKIWVQVVSLRLQEGSQGREESQYRIINGEVPAVGNGAQSSGVGGALRDTVWSTS